MTDTPDSPAAHCADIVAAYHGAIDRGRATAAIDHFTDDAHFEVGGRQLKGRAEILGFLTDREARTDRQTVHVVANAVTGVRHDEVTVDALILLHVRGPEGAYALERVLDTTHLFRHTPDGWKIAVRSSSRLHAESAATTGARA